MLEKDKIREANNAKIVNKTLRKAIMARTRLQISFLKKKQNNTKSYTTDDEHFVSVSYENQ